MQKMEYDADRFEARLAGSRCFATTCWQMQLLNLCFAGAVEDLNRFKREGRLPDNLPALVVANVPLVPKELLRKVEETRDERVVQALMTSVRQLHDYLVEIKSVCSGVHYPFSHAKGNVSLGFYLIRKDSSRDDYGQVIEDSMELIKSTGIVMQRCASRLASIAEKVEGAFGLQPLDLPSELTEIEEEEETE